MMKDLYFVNYEEQNIVINYEMVDEQKNLTYITPSGKPFVLPQSYQPSFTGTINGNEPRDLLGIPRGTLLGFKDNNGKKWLANFTDPSNGSISFNGYKNDKEIKEIKITQGNEHNILAGIENNDCHLEILFGKFNYSIEFDKNYRGEGEIIKGEEVQFADKEFLVKSIRLYDNCIPDHWLELPSINYEIFSNNVSARYNAYEKGGVLCKLSTGNYYYSNTDLNGEAFYMMWNEVGERWDLWTPPNPDCLSCELRELLTIRTLVGLFVEDGHMMLDVIGMVPVVGELADGLNGVWYLIEGENGEAAMCMASAVPFIGWVSKGGKWFLKGGKKVSSFVVKNSDNALKIIKKNENIFAEITKRINDSPNFSIESVELLTTDLKSNEKLLNSLIEKPEFVESWKVLSDFPLLRKNPGNLEVLSKVKGKFTYGGKTGQDALEEIFTGHKSAQKFIDNFKSYDNLLGDVDVLTVSGIKSSSEVRILNNGNQVGKFVDGKLNVNYSGFGGDVVCDVDKTTTILGKWEDPAGGGTSEIINSKLSKSGQNHGGANALSESIPDGWSDKQIWDNINEPWLRDAAERSDIIRVVSDPTLPSNIYKPDGTLSFFGKEHELLTKPVSQGGLGYTYNPGTYTYIK
ncbi:hypothetical protein [Labilibaculum manganireducens]|uniref:hypothetical protein n=1 Tax=Labilibaculum manganireducens TaxID=1940525 RepID=UPI0029F5BB79|nr:hypothetical protein [Labilibaculum manganireducens]